MSRLVLVPWPETAWSAEERIVSHSPVPLSEAGRKHACEWARVLEPVGIGLVFSSDEVPSRETAEIVAAQTGAAHKTVTDLAELDAGLWDGLSSAELKRRFPKVFKRWQEDPSAVCPPGGEDFGAACERLSEAMDRILEKAGDKAIALVLGPRACVLARCILEGVDPADIKLGQISGPVVYDLDENGRSGVPPALIGPLESEREPAATSQPGRDEAPS